MYVKDIIGQFNFNFYTLKFFKKKPFFTKPVGNILKVSLKTYVNSMNIVYLVVFNPCHST